MRTSLTPFSMSLSNVTTLHGSIVLMNAKCLIQFSINEPFHEDLIGYMSKIPTRSSKILLSASDHIDTTCQLIFLTSRCFKNKHSRFSWMIPITMIMNSPRQFRNGMLKVFEIIVKRVSMRKRNKAIRFIPK